MSNHLEQCLWLARTYPNGISVSAAVKNWALGTTFEAEYQAFRLDGREDPQERPQYNYTPLCPRCTLHKAHEKATAVLLGDEKVIADARTLYALAATLIGILNHGRYAGLFALPAPAINEVKPPPAEAAP
jgi:hypothetical protein